MRIKIFREKAGVISEKAIWILYLHGCYMYGHETLWGLFKLLITEWKHDKHLVG